MELSEEGLAGDVLALFIADEPVGSEMAGPDGRIAAGDRVQQGLGGGDEVGGIGGSDLRRRRSDAEEEERQR